MVETSQSPKNPITIFVAGALLLPSTLILTAYVVWITTHNLVGTYWMTAILAAAFTLVEAYKMIASRWDSWWVALFTTASATLMGTCFAGASILANDWWMLVAMGLLFVTMLIILFTDLDDYMKLPLIVLAMIAEFSAVWIFFKWLSQLPVTL